MRADAGMAARLQSPPTSIGPEEHPSHGVPNTEGTSNAPRIASEISPRPLQKLVENRVNCLDAYNLSAETFSELTPYDYIYKTWARARQVHR